jgi:D-cysteine desulfhydrase
MGESRPVESKGLPLYDRFRALTAVPRVTLGAYPSPIERIDIPSVGELWLKRDDLNAPLAAGNKVRALEFLLGGVKPGDVVLTAGGEGSTHVYATAVHAARLGARTIAVRWKHEMHPQAEAIALAAMAVCEEIRSYRWPATALLQLGLWRAGVSPRPEGISGGYHYVPIGGSSPLGVLGHVNAGLELASQIARGAAPAPTHLVVPLGTGGTAAGLAAGLGIAGLATTVVGARVAPRIVVDSARVHLLIRRTLRLIARMTRAEEPLRAAPLVIDHTVYGGAYGRPLPAAASAATIVRAAYDSPALRTAAPVLDATYSAKATAAALGILDRGPSGTRVMLWVTFDGRTGRPYGAGPAPTPEFAA